MATPLLIYALSILLQSGVHCFENTTICPKIYWQLEKDLFNCNSIAVSPPFTPKEILPQLHLRSKAVSSLNEFYQNHSVQHCTRSNFFCETVPTAGRRVDLHCHTWDRQIRIEVLESWPPPSVTSDVCLWICRDRQCGDRRTNFRLFTDAEEARLGHVMVRICESTRSAGDGLDCDYDRYGMFMDRQRKSCAAYRSVVGQWIREAYVAFIVVGVFLSSVTMYMNLVLIRRLFFG